MRNEPEDWPAPELSTTSPDAVIYYRRGIAALVAGVAHADALLGGALAADADFYLAHLGLAVALAVMGARFVPPRSTGVLTRGERQHSEIVVATFTDASQHANDLRREHLLEYPGDLLIVWLPALPVWRRANT
jgi:hypothetical protein